MKFAMTETSVILKTEYEITKNQNSTNISKLVRSLNTTDSNYTVLPLTQTPLPKKNKIKIRIK